MTLTRSRRLDSGHGLHQVRGVAEAADADAADAAAAAATAATAAAATAVLSGASVGSGVVPSEASVPRRSA